MRLVRPKFLLKIRARFRGEPMHVFKLRATKLRMTKKGIEESQRHLQLKSSKTTLTSNSEI
jgi:hypothetical protein